MRPAAERTRLAGVAGPGGGSDVLARAIVTMMEKEKLAPTRMMVINKPGDLTLQALFDKLDLPLRREDLQKMPVLLGGPVHTERGFVLHDPVRMEDPAQDGGSIYASTLTVPGGLEMTTSRDVLEALSSGAGPRRVMITLGYASWGEGQLESELAENSWLTVPADAGIVFDTPLAQRYDKALDLLGLKSWMLSPEAGHA